MTVRNTVATLVIVRAMGCGHAKAQSVLEIAVGIKFCRTLTDDAQRLKCFDGLFAEKDTKAPTAAAEPKTVATWSIEETKSPLDDSPQVSGTLLAGEAAIILRCKERKTEAIFVKQFTYLGSDNVKVLVRINDGQVIETAWRPASTGKGAFAPSPVQFIRALPDNGKLFIRATGYGGKTVDGEFNLGLISEVRDKIAAACKWPQGGPTPPATPSTHR
jgi:hypothetical protein